MTKLRKFAAATPFAQLLGMRAEEKETEEEKARKAKKAESDKDEEKAEEEEERKQAEDESDEDYAKRMEEMDEEEEKAKKAKKAEADEDEEKAEEGEKEEKAKASERSRCAKIVAQGIKLGLTNQACSLAFDTTLSVEQASSILAMTKQDVSANQGGSLDKHMAGVNIPTIGANAGPNLDPNSPEGKAAAIVAAAKAYRP